MLRPGISDQCGDPLHRTMRAVSSRLPPLPRPAPRHRPPRGLLLALSCLATGALANPPAPASATAVPDPLGERLRPALQETIARLVQQALPAAPQSTAARIEVRLGALDTRVKLAPCAQATPYWPAGQRVLSLARVGLRCSDGPVRWNVFVPVQIQVWGPALVAASALAPGTTLAAEHLQSAEVDLLARHDAAVTDATWALGRQLAAPLAAGQALRMADLRLRQWVKPGDTVRVLARGESFLIATEAQALAPALEGQPVRVRFEGGRVLQGVATGERQVTVPL